MLGQYFCRIRKIILISIVLFPLLVRLIDKHNKNDDGEGMTTLRVFRKTTPLVYTIRLSLLPLAGLSLSAFATQVDIAPGSLDKEDVLTVVGEPSMMRIATIFAS